MLTLTLYRDVKKSADNTRNGAGIREDFALAGNGDEDFKYPYVKWGEGGDHYPIFADIRSEITILPLNY